MKTTFYLSRKLEILNHLGNKCKKCNSLENLEVDHIDPTTKKYTILEMTHNNNKFREELSKLQILCENCHHQKTFMEQAQRLCKRGHERTPDNVTPGNNCKKCMNLRAKVRRAAKRL